MSKCAVPLQVSDRARRVVGRVVGNRGDKTVTVQVERRVRHPLYGKYLTRSSRYHAHDADNECQLGDWVTIGETRPISRSKSWMLISVDQRAEGDR